MEQCDGFDMKEVIFHGVNNTKILHVNWNFTEICNYRCSYCFTNRSERTSIKKYRFDSLKGLYKVADKLLALNKEAYFFNLTGGGEPTVQPHLVEFLNYLAKSNKKIYTSLTTNGSKGVAFFETIFKIPNIRFLINHSVHLEFFRINHTKEIIKVCNKLNVPISIYCMFNPDFREEIRAVAEEFILFRKEYLFNFRIDELRSGKNHAELDGRYTQEDLDWANNARKEFQVSVSANQSDNSFFDDAIFETPQYRLKDGSIKFMPHYNAFKTGRKDFRGRYQSYSYP